LLTAKGRYAELYRTQFKKDREATKDREVSGNHEVGRDGDGVAEIAGAGEAIA
jgi:ATP-binding cassette subfamily C protein